MGDGGRSSLEGSFEQESRLFSETERLMAEVVEKGGSMDPNALAAKRSQLSQLYVQMGVANDDGTLNVDGFLDLTTQLARKKDTPVKPQNYPDYDFFSEKYEEIVHEDESLKEIRGRGVKTEEYLYGLGIVMANKIPYEVLFENDPILVNKRGKIQNGRHRNLARDVLSRTGFNTAGWSWVTTEVEE